MKKSFLILLILSLSLTASELCANDSLQLDKQDSLTKVSEDDVFGEFEDFDQEKNENLKCTTTGCQYYDDCAYGNKVKIPFWLYIVLIAGVAVGFLVWYRKNLNFKTISIVLIIIGVLLTSALISFRHDKTPESIEGCDLIEEDTLSATELVFVEEEQSLKDTVNEFQNDDDEFSELDEFDEFEEFDAEEDFGSAEPVSGTTATLDASKDSWAKKNKLLLTTLGILLVTIISGILVRFPFTRKLRPVFLLISIIYLGFIVGACPCMISSLQDVILLGIGREGNWVKTIWVLGLIPITYVFGKVWCGWVCHLGGLQEFLFIYRKQTVLQSAKAQKVLRIVRIVLLLTLVTQIFITRTNEYCKIDPFLVAFNLRSANITGYVLLGLLLLSSLFIYRPFCRGACPVGLILGWVEKIPGASIIGKTEGCISCVTCSKSCKIKAITRDEKKTVLENQECIMCGDCLDTCNKNSMKLVRKNKSNHDKIEL